MDEQIEQVANELTTDDRVNMRWNVVWRGWYPMRGEQWLDENFPEHRNIRYNGGLKADGRHSKGDSRLQYCEKRSLWTAEVFY